MLLRHISGYAPANLITALSAFIAIYAFTRLLGPAQYGVYALAASIALLCQAIFFYWLQVGAMRFIARAVEQRQLPIFTKTIYAGFAICALLFTLAYVLCIALLPLDPQLRNALWLALPLIVGRALVTINQAFHRAALRVLRYSLVEAGQALLGLTLGWLLIAYGGWQADGILLGLIAASWLLALLDLPFIWRRATVNSAANIDRVELRQLLAFGLPLTLAYALNFILSSADRLLVEHYLGASAVGIYAVSYGVIERALTAIFVLVSMASFPLAVRVLEQDGPDAARQQIGRNGSALLGLTLPACAGLIIANQHVAAVLIGPEFRAEALTIMPWIALSTLLAGWQIHYFDHAFHLGRRTGLFIWSAGPAALLNIGLNMYWLPRIGLIGAVYATVIGYAAALFGSIVVGRRVFAISFPWLAAVRIAFATALMTLGLTAINFPKTGIGLAALIVSGALIYATSALLLNVANTRTLLLQRFAKHVMEQP